MRQAREGDPDDPFTRGLRHNYSDLEKQKNASLEVVGQLDTADRSGPPKAGDLSWLEALPYYPLITYPRRRKPRKGSPTP